MVHNINVLVSYCSMVYLVLDVFTALIFTVFVLIF